MSSSSRYRSWGGQPPSTPARVVKAAWRADPLPPEATAGGMTCLPFGNGRSYGDSCLNNGGVLVDARGLDRFIAFDPATGLLHCEAGVLLSEIIALTLPKGWFLPVTPGTRFVTVGGAIANDVHGKNHHRAGTFGHHVRSLTLVRSDGTRLTASDAANPELLRATIGGLGLTGLVTDATIQLKAVAGPFIDQEVVPFASVDEFFRLAGDTDQRFEHTVAWVDCAAAGRSLGRGVLLCGNHSPMAGGRERAARRLTFPLTPPVSLVNGTSLKAFNELYFRLNRWRQGRSRVHYAPFFYPLDNLLSWNRMYGPRGFFQYQCVVPLGVGQAAIREILERIGRAGAGSFLAVLKRFGNRPAKGMLSFPREGYTLALDFPNQGQRTLALLDALDEVTGKAGGAVYPAKDARMAAASFQAWYPRWRELSRHVDPAFSSSFWRRVTAAPG